MTAAVRPEPSFEKFHYALRPSKQLERKLFIEVLHRLAKAGYLLSDYTYFGMGSVYYADFILFHKYLLIDRMICVEGSGKRNRMEFNQPYQFIDLRMDLVADVLPEIKPDIRYLVWLDYDYALNSDILSDAASCVGLLSQGSIFIVTVEAEPRLLMRNEEADCDDEREKLVLGRLDSELGRYAGGGALKPNVLTREDLPKFFATVLRNRIVEEMGLHSPLGLIPLFNCRYADGAQMLSYGGIIGDSNDADRIRAAGIFDLPFVTEKPEPKPISVPPLTAREKLWLDQHLGRVTAAEALAKFDLREDYFHTFAEFYRHYPMFVETLT